MLHIYSIPISNDDSVINDQADILEDLQPFSIPWKLWYGIMEDENRSNTILYYFTLGDTTQCNTAQYYFAYKSL